MVSACGGEGDEGELLQELGRNPGKNWVVQSWSGWLGEFLGFLINKELLVYQGTCTFRIPLSLFLCLSFPMPSSSVLVSSCWPVHTLYSPLWGNVINIIGFSSFLYLCELENNLEQFE